MATTPATIPVVSYGVDNLLTGFIVLNEEITETDIVHQISDQKGAISAEYPYDKRYDLTPHRARFWQFARLWRGRFFLCIRSLEG